MSVRRVIKKRRRRKINNRESVIIHSNNNNNNTNNNFKEKNRVEEELEPQVPMCDMLALFPEEILLIVLSYLNVTDLYNACLVNSVWKRLCEDEFIFRAVCSKNYPCLRGASRPPFEDSWKSFYTARKAAFCVLGGPISQASCMEDICSKLRSAGLPHVDGIFAQKRIPTLEELQRYCAVLVYSYNSSAFLDGGQMGDLLADYVDNGGGVVVTVFTNCNNLRNGFIRGRFLDGGYHPIVPARQHDTNGKRPLLLGKINEPNHPIMAGVESLDGGRSSFFCPGALHPKAHAVAEWSNGAPLAVELPMEKGTVVGLNLFPPSSDTGDARFWQASSDGAILLANCLVFAGRSAVLRKRRAPHSPMVDAQGNYITKDSHNNKDNKDKSRDRDRDGGNRDRELHRERSDGDLTDSPDAKKRRPFSGARMFGRKLLSRWLYRKSPE